MPVAAFALHAIFALCTVHSSPALWGLYTYLNRLKLLSGSRHQVFTAFSAHNIKVAAVARAGSRVNSTYIALAWRKALSALIKADPPVFLGGMNDCPLSGTTLARLRTMTPAETERSFLAFTKKLVLACSSLDPEASTDPDMTAGLIESLQLGTRTRTNTTPYGTEASAAG